VTDIALLNRTYFQCLRVAAVRSVPKACTGFGVHKEIAEAVAAMTMEDIKRLCLPGLVLFDLKLTPAQFKALLKAPGHAQRQVMAMLAATEAEKMAATPHLNSKGRRAPAKTRSK
jgi:hypothetical protein